MNLKALSAALLAAGSVSAYAVGPGALGNIDNMSVVIGNNVSPPVFFDTYSFSVTGPNSTLSGGAFAVYISSFTAVLQDSTFAAIGSDTSPWDGFTFSGLAAGNYALSFFGATTNAAAAYGGVITTVVTAAPVPEPETYALMLAGLGMVGFIASRRRHNG